MSSLRERLRGSLWPLPVLAVVLAIGLGVGLPALDQALEQPGGEHPLTFVFGGGPTVARDVLAAIAGSLISVTGLTFSFTVVALQLSSSQHSPRLLQTFETDRVVQSTLAALVGTFVFALTVLRTIRIEQSEGDAFVPRLSVTVAFVLTVLSVIGLVLFLGHLARSLRVESMLRDVSVEARATFDRELPPDEQGVAGAPAFAVPEGEPSIVPATSSGFLVDVDDARVAQAAEDAGATVLLAHRIGNSVVTGTPLAHVWPGPAGSRADVDAVHRALEQGVRLGFERTPQRDVAYSLRKSVDITVRALSPGTNDPTTAVHGLSHVSALLGELVTRPLLTVVVRDGSGTVRFVRPQWDAPELLRLGIEEPLQFAGGQPAVLRRLATLLRELAFRAPRGTLDGELLRLLERVGELARDTTGIERAETDRWDRVLRDALTGRWPAEPG